MEPFRPGFLGEKRDEKFKEWDQQFGIDGWEIVWKINAINDHHLDFLGACALYEDAYFEFFNNNPMIFDWLVNEATNVYDDRLSNIKSGLDYHFQESKLAHIKDIAIRRCVIRMGNWFM